jgi:hypothetical protein
MDELLQYVAQLPSAPLFTVMLNMALKQPACM